MISLLEAKEKELVSSDVMEEVTRINQSGRCLCGEKLVFTDNLVNLFCPNRLCFFKLAARIEEMAKMLSVDGFGYSTCVEICKQIPVESPCELFEFTEDEINSLNNISAVNKKFSALKEVLNKEYKLHEVVRMLRMKGLDTSANKLFKRFNSMDDFFKEFDAGGVKFVSDTLGIGKGTESIMAIDIYKTIKDSREELYKAERIFKINKDGSGAELQIAITGSLIGYKKAKYVSFLNEKLKGRLTVVMGNSVTMETKYLVCDADESGSTKYTAALNKGIPIVSSKELVNILGL